MCVKERKRDNFSNVTPNATVILIVYWNNKIDCTLDRIFQVKKPRIQHVMTSGHGSK